MDHNMLIRIKFDLIANVLIYYFNSKYLKCFGIIGAIPYEELKDSMERF